MRLLPIPILEYEMNNTNEFTILDWIGWLYVLFNLPILFFFSKFASIYNEMYMSFGSTLPKFTVLVMQPWFTILLGVVSVLIFSLQLHGRIKCSLKRRRAVVVFAFFWSSISVFVCVIGLYEPIIQMATAVS